MYDLIIIGGGPGGYTAGLSAAQKDKRVLLIEKEKIGGVCLNEGCIPTKSLLHSSKLFKKVQCSSLFGVEVSDVKFNYQKAHKWKNEVVNQLGDNLSRLLHQKGIDVINGHGEITSNNTVEIGSKTYKTGKILIATGSKTYVPPIEGIENTVTSRDILNLEEKPEVITIIGGGVIGVEFASFFTSIGTKVNLIEKEKRVLPNIEKRISSILQKSLNINYYTDSVITEIDKGRVTLKKSGKEHYITSDLILNATGRTPNCEQFSNLGIVKESRIVVDNKMETNIKNIYAVGDVTGKSLLAHGAAYMADIAVENMFGNSSGIDINSIPSVVYSDPEVASAGYTTEEIKSSGIPFLRSSFKLDLNGRYLAENGNDNGLCIVLVNKENKKILGVHMIGSGVSEIISYAQIAIKNSFTVDQFLKNIFPHPTVSESLKDSFYFIK